MNKFSVWRIELPVQELVKRDGGRVVEVDGSEMHGAHRAVVVASPGRLTIVVPLTSATNNQGEEKWRTVRGSWLRLNHLGKPVYAQCEQLRAVDDYRFYEQEGELSPYDANLLDVKLKAMLGFI